MNVSARKDLRDHLLSVQLTAEKTLSREIKKLLEGHRLAPGRAGAKILVSRVVKHFSLKLTNFLICFEFWKRDCRVFLNVLEKKWNLPKDIDLLNLSTRSGHVLPIPCKICRSQPKRGELLTVWVLMWHSSLVAGHLPLPILCYISLCPMIDLLY